MIEFKPRYFVLHAPADGGRAQGACTPQMRDAGIRASFAAVSRAQSATAAKACAVAGNTLP
jgi:hypothetical protein